MKGGIKIWIRYNYNKSIKKEYKYCSRVESGENGRFLVATRDIQPLGIKLDNVSLNTEQKITLNKEKI